MGHELISEYPYFQNIILIWAKIIIPPVFLFWIFLLNRRSDLKTKTIAKFFIAAFVFAFSIAFIKSVLQFFVWKESAMTAFLLPPHNPTYFYNYVFFRFFLPELFSFAAAAIFGGTLYIIRFFSQGKALYKSEVLLGSLVAFLVGWPAVIIFVPAVFFSMALWRIGKIGAQYLRFSSFDKTDEAVEVSPFLFGLAGFLLLFGKALVDFLKLDVFKIIS